MSLSKMNNKKIRQIIDDLNGLEFNDSKPYSEKAKIFFEDRYSTIFSLFPEINKNDLGLEIGLSGGILAFSLKQIYNLNKLFTLEHPVTYKKYNIKFINKLKKNNIQLEPIDLRMGKLPWKDNSFNFVVFSEVMEHLIPSDIPAIISEINRILKIGGWLLVTTPNISSLLKRINLLIGKNPIEFDLNLHSGATYGHIREYTLSEVITILQNNNFDIKRKGYFSIDAKRNIFVQIESISAKFISSFGNNLYVIGQKSNNSKSII